MESLRLRRDFKKVTREGQKWVTPAFVLYVFFDSKNKKADISPQVGFTVTKKTISKKAVIRNRAKRRLREAFRLTIGDYQLDKGRLVVVARKDALELPFDKLQKDIRWALKRLGVERKNSNEIPAEAGIHGHLSSNYAKASLDRSLEFRNNGYLSIPQKICLYLIRGYKIILSPLAGNQCRYQPTCSEYMKQAIIRFGVVRGIWLGTKRIFRCTPWGSCGHDDVPNTFSWFSNGKSSASVRPNSNKNCKNK